MIELILHNGMSAFMDDEDAELAAGKEWRANWPGYYVCRYTNNKLQILHRLILGLDETDNLLVDHINGNSLDNRRCNLRTATKSQNSSNKTRRDIDRVNGVFPNQASGGLGYEVRCYRHYPTTIIRPFGTVAEAARAHDALTILDAGEFAQLNFPLGYESLLPDRLVSGFQAAKLSPFKYPKDYPNGS